MSKRGWLLLGSAVPVVALIALLAWASLQPDDSPEGFVVNEDLGELDISEDRARDFSLELFDGSDVALSDFRGKAVMLDFWSSWCAPCQWEAPTLSQVYGEYRDRGVEFIGVAIWDSTQSAEDFVDEFDVPYPSGVDSDGLIIIDYGIKGIPEKIFIDADGVIRKKFVGPMDADTLRATLNSLLEGATPGS